MKKLGLIFIACIFLDCNKKQDVQSNNQLDQDFTFATWTNPGGEFDKEKWESKLALYDSLGISEVLVGGSPDFYNQLIPLASEKGIKIHAWMWTLNRRTILLRISTQSGMQ